MSLVRDITMVIGRIIAMVLLTIRLNVPNAYTTTLLSHVLNSTQLGMKPLGQKTDALPLTCYHKPYHQEKRNLNALKTVLHAQFIPTVSLDVAVMVFVKKIAGMNLVGHNLLHQQAHHHVENSTMTVIWLKALKLLRHLHF